jgi:CelD/BcsL family acetyltransferase involved in cellulose biosynthesis
MNELTEAMTRPVARPSAQTTPSLVRTVYTPGGPTSGFDALAKEWNALLSRTRFRSPFLTHEWQTTWWRYLGEGDLWIVAWRDAQTNRLVGIAPLYRITFASGELAGKTQINIVGCIEVSDYLDILVDECCEDAVYADFTEWLLSDDAPPWDLVDLCNLPEESRTWQAMPSLFAQAGLAVRTFQEDVAPQFALPLHYEAYLQEQVEKKQRHEIRRKQRRAEREAEIGFYFVGREHSLEAEVDDFIALQRASRADKSEFMTPPMRRFFHGAARALFDAGWLRLSFLTINGEKAASLFAIEYDRRFLLYNSGYDPEAHAQLSPGWVQLAYAIQYAVAVGNTHFDFMQGDEAYKYYFGSKDYRVMRVIAEHTGA